MMRLREPVRWSDSGADAPAELAAAIRAARTPRSSATRVSGLRLRLARELAAPATRAIADVPSFSKWLLPSVIACALGALGYLHLHASRTQLPRAAVPSARPSALAPPSIVRVTPPAIAAPQTSVRAAEPNVRAHAPARIVRKSRNPRKLETPQAAQPEAELRLLERAQLALEREPTQTLALCAEHAANYARGIYAQEREILTIEALLKLGQKPLALARAERFIDSYPRSPHAQRVRMLIDRSRAAADATSTPASGHSIENEPSRGGEHEKP